MRRLSTALGALATALVMAASPAALALAASAGCAPGSTCEDGFECTTLGSDDASADLGLAELAPRCSDPDCDGGDCGGAEQRDRCPPACDACAGPLAMPCVALLSQPAPTGPRVLVEVELPAPDDPAPQHEPGRVFRPPRA